MASPVVRGYVLKQSFSFIEKRFNPAMAAKVMATLPREVIELKGGTKDASWYPRAHFATLLRGIASARNDEKGSYEDLVACGEFIASEAANTFLKLVLKILTPRLFAKKIPELWDRDHQGGGRFEVTAVDDRHIDLNLLDVKGFDHIGCISVGWIMFGLKAMGKNEVVVDLKGWSLREPGPEQVHYRIEWS